jgi:AhpD family alkylhydroperoxidase
MNESWNATVTANKRLGAEFAATQPDFLAAFRKLNETQGATGMLDGKTRELIAMAVAVTTRCEGCIGAHAAAAVKAGATEVELTEALATAIALNAGAAYVYSLKAISAFREFESS